MSIKDKVIIVTGGSSGIGFASVKELLRSEPKYIAIFDLPSSAKEAAESIANLEKEFGKGKVGFYTCDVTDKNLFAARYEELSATQGTVDILINNAGILNDANPELEIDINFKGLVNCSLIAIERMGTHRNGKGGTIVNLCSILGLTTHPAMPIYVGTKHAVYGFTKSMKEYEELIGVRVLAVCPGVTQTNLFSEALLTKSILSFAPKRFAADFINWQQPLQSPENVAICITSIINKGRGGDMFLSELQKPPQIVNDSENYQKRSIAVE